MKKLKSLADHNAQFHDLYLNLNSNEPRLNGLACPECNEELYDSTPMRTLASIPPKKNVHCSKCSYTGYRIA
jgi:uncharacterized protein with PIN domain